MKGNAILAHTASNHSRNRATSATIYVGMRLWTLHPRYLDSKGLVAAWREALLAQKVLAGRTTGYRHHPQLMRFRAFPEPLAAIASFLVGIADEAERRGYKFDLTRIVRRGFESRIPETRGQLEYEWRHLRAKLRVRSPDLYRAFQHIAFPRPHPLFRIVPGEIKPWERR